MSFTDHADPSLAHVDHVGSLVRPLPLMQMMQTMERGEDHSPEHLRTLQDRSIEQVVKRQEELGLPQVTDGEFRRRGWQRGVVDSVGGFTTKPGGFPFRNAAGIANVAVAFFVTRKIERRKGIATDEFSFLRGIARHTPKVTMPSPTVFHFGLFNECADKAVYPDIEEFFADLVAVYRAEIAALADLGCTHIQLDEVSLALMCDPDHESMIREQGEEPAALQRRYVALINDILRDKPAGLRVGMHLCRGNQAGLWAGAGGYEPIAESLFNEIAVDAYLLEYDTERAGGFEPLRLLPPGRRAYIGAVSTKDPAIESEASLIARIKDAARHAPIEQLGLTSQCGFASSISTWNKTANPMTEAIQWQKLAQLVRAARQIWK